MSVNTKEFIKAIRPEVISSGLANEVKVRLRQFGLNFQTPVWDNDENRYRKFFKLAAGLYPETLDTAQVRNAAAQIPASYSGLRRAIADALGEPNTDATTPANAATPADPNGDVNTAELIAVVKASAQRYNWCDEAEDALTESFDLRFHRYAAQRFTLLPGNPETLTRESVSKFVTDMTEQYEDTDVDGVLSLLGDIRDRWVGGNTTTASPATGRYRVGIQTVLTANQLRALGWDGTSELNGLQVNYSGIQGVVTSAANA